MGKVCTYMKRFNSYIREVHNSNIIDKFIMEINPNISIMFPLLSVSVAHPTAQFDVSKTNFLNGNPPIKKKVITVCSVNSSVSNVFFFLQIN